MERKKLLLVMLAIAILFGTTYSVMFVMYPASGYGDIVIYNERTDDELSEGDVLNVQDGDYIVAWLREDATKSRKPTDEEFVTYLYKSDGTLIEIGRDRETVGDSYRWWFDLDQCHEGTFTYYVNFFVNLGMGNVVDGDSFSFTVVNGEVPSYEPPTIIDYPSVTEFDEGDLATITWTFEYDGPCEVFLSSSDGSSDGGVLQSLDYGISTGERTFNYLVDTSVVGTQELTLTVNPDTEGIASVSADPVTITIGEPTDTTTTTTDTTTTTTTTTDTTTTITTTDTTTIPTEEIFDDTAMYTIGIIGIAILFVIIWRRK